MIFLINYAFLNIFLKLIIIKEIGLKNLFLKKLMIILIGLKMMLIIFLIIFIVFARIFTLVLTINLLIKSIYVIHPSIIAKNMNNLISPLLKVNIAYNTRNPVNSQNTMSSIYVTISGVLNVFLNILKISNKKPIIIPNIMNIRKIIA